jgi:hypothetical protein
MFKIVSFSQKPQQFNNQKNSVDMVRFPNEERNYCLFNKDRINYFLKQKESALPYLKTVLQTSKNESEIVEALYILDRMLENNVKGIDSLYPFLSKFNDTKSANIQVYLAGIYRKTQVPDAFGPLISMLIKNSLQKPEAKQQFDPNEEIGGAILEYIKNYSNTAQKIDYKA